jgi:hypothetical protein
MACSRSIFATSNVGKTGTPGRDWPRRLSDPRVNHDIGLSQSFAVSTKRGTQSSFSAMTGCSKYGSSWRLARSRYRERRCQCRGCRKRSTFQPLMPCARPFWRSRERRILTDAGITTLLLPPISMALRSLRLRPECANSGHCRGDGPRPP